MAPHGTDAGREVIVHARGRGYGLMRYINSGADDPVHVAETLEEPFAGCEAGTRFDDKRTPT
jgi:hypothetical protein